MAPVLYEEDIDSILYDALKKKKDLYIEIEKGNDYPITAEIHRALVNYDGIMEWDTFYSMSEGRETLANIIVTIYNALQNGRSVWINDRYITEL